jgi:hypothetical protein
MYSITSDELEDWLAELSYLSECLRKVSKSILVAEQTICRLKIAMNDILTPALPGIPFVTPAPPVSLPPAPISTD